MIHINLRQAFLILLTAAPLIFFGCCPTTSQYPLSDAGNPKFDEKLAGTWRTDTDSGQAYLHIGKGKGNLTEIQLVEHRRDGTLSNAAFITFPSTIDQDRFLNVQSAVLPEGKYEGYIFVLYSFPDDNHLSLSNWDEEVLEKAILEGRLKGEITQKKDPESNRKTKCVRITDKTENLRQFIKAQGKEKIFTNPVGTFEKMTGRRVLQSAPPDNAKQPR